MVPLMAALLLLLALPQTVQADEPILTYTVVRHALTATASGEVQAQVHSHETAYVVNGNLWAPSSLPVEVRYNSAGQVAGVSGVEEIIGNSLAIWSAVTPTTFSFVYGAPTSAHPGSCDSTIQLDGINTIKFTAIGGNTLGLMCTVFLGTAADAKLVEFDMLLSNTANIWSTLDKTPVDRFDLASTILHELGHAAGLGHSDNLASVMHATLATGTQLRSLSADDIAGLKAAYPVAAVAGASAPPSPAPVASAAQGIERGSYQLRAASVARD